MSQPFSARDVLEQLDYDAGLFYAAFYPDFDHGYNYHVDARMSLYADKARWAIVIEQLTVNPRAGPFPLTSLYFHGTGIDLSKDRTSKYDYLILEDILSDGPSGPLIDFDVGENVRTSAKDVRIRGNVVPIRTDENYYWARNIDVQKLTHEELDNWIRQARVDLPPEEAEKRVREYEENERPRVGRFELRPWDLIRGMVPEHREALLASDGSRTPPGRFQRSSALDDDRKLGPSQVHGG